MKKWTNAEVIELSIEETSCYGTHRPHHQVVVVTTPDQTIVEETIVEEIVNSKS